MLHNNGQVNGPCQQVCEQRGKALTDKSFSPGDGTVPIETGPCSGPSGTQRELQSHAGQPSSQGPASVAPVKTKEHNILLKYNTEGACTQLNSSSKKMQSQCQHCELPQ